MNRDILHFNHLNILRPLDKKLKKKVVWWYCHIAKTGGEIIRSSNLIGNKAWGLFLTIKSRVWQMCSKSWPCGLIDPLFNKIIWSKWSCIQFDPMIIMILYLAWSYDQNHIALSFTLWSEWSCNQFDFMISIQFDLMIIMICI